MHFKNKYLGRTSTKNCIMQFCALIDFRFIRARDWWCGAPIDFETSQRPCAPMNFCNLLGTTHNAASVAGWWPFWLMAVAVLPTFTVFSAQLKPSITESMVVRRTKRAERRTEINATAERRQAPFLRHYPNPKVSTQLYVGTWTEEQCFGRAHFVSLNWWPTSLVHNCVLECNQTYTQYTFYKMCARCIRISWTCLCITLRVMCIHII